MQKQTHLYPFVLICAIITLTDSFLLQDQNELVYDYRTVTSAGVFGNHKDTSNFTLNATITLRTYNDLTFVTLSDVQYDFRIRHDEVTVDSTKLNTNALKRQFAIRYEPNGKIIEILNEVNDEMWSVNFKKGIASLFQLDLNQISKEKDFDTKESSLNGQCSVSYNLSQKDNRYEVVKQIDSTSCLRQRWFKKSELVMGKCKSDTFQPLTSVSKRTYSLDNIKGNVTIDSIKNENSITNTPIPGGWYIQSIWAEQNVKLIKKKKFNSSWDPYVGGMISRKLLTNFLSEDEKMYDISGDSKTKDIDLLMHELREDIKWFGKINGNDETVRMSKKFNVMNIIVRNMEKLNGNKLDELLKDVLIEYYGCNNCDKTFHDAISQVGTYSSMMFIKYLIVKHRSYEQFPEGILNNLVDNWKTPDVELVKNFFELLEPKMELNEKLWNHLMLIVSSMLSKIENEEEMKDMTTFFINIFNSAVTESKKIQYIAAVWNIKAKSTIDFLMSIIRGDTEEAPFIRTLAIWALKDIHEGIPDMMDFFYLPLILNKREHFTVRCASMDVYMDDPTIEKLKNLSAVMEQDEDENVKNAFRTRVKSLASSKLPCYKEVSEYANQLMADFQNEFSEVFKGTFQYVLDYSDPNKNFSKIFTFTKTGHLYRDGFFLITIDPIPNDDEAIDSYKNIYMRAQLNSSLEPTGGQKNARGKIYTASLIEDIIDCSSISWDVLAVKDGQVVKIFNRIPCLTDESLMKFLLSYSSDYKQVVLPTDVGFPAVLFSQKYNNRFIDGSYERIRGSSELEMDVVIMNNLKYGLKFYNPVANLWHGVKKHMAWNIDTRLGFANNASSAEGSEIFRREYFIGHIRDGGLTTKSFDTITRTDIFIEDQDWQWERGIVGCDPKDTWVNRIKKEHSVVEAYEYYEEYQLPLFDCENRNSSMNLLSVKKLYNLGTTTKLNYYSMKSLHKKVFYVPKKQFCGVRLMKLNPPIITQQRTSYGRRLPEMFHSMLDDNGIPKRWSLRKDRSSPLKFSAILQYGMKQPTYHIEGQQDFDNFTALVEFRLFTEDKENPTDITVTLKAENRKGINEDVNDKDVYDDCIKSGSKSLECTKKINYLKNYNIQCTFKNVSQAFANKYQGKFTLFNLHYHVYNISPHKTPNGVLAIQMGLVKMNKAVNALIARDHSTRVYKELPLDGQLTAYLPRPISSHFFFWGMLNTNHPPLETITVKYDPNSTGNWSQVIADCTNEVCDYKVLVQGQPEHKLLMSVEIPDGELSVIDVASEGEEDKGMISLLWNEKLISVDDSGYYSDDRFNVKLIDGPRMFLELKDEMLVIDYTSAEINVHYPRYNVNYNEYFNLTEDEFSL